MEILILQDYLRCGGTEQQSVFLARSWTESRHPARLLTFRPGGALAAPAREAGLAVQSLQKRDLGLNWWAPGLRRSLRQASPSLVLCMGRMANCYGWYLRRILPGVPVIATVRTGKPLPFFYRLSLRQATMVVANSHALGKEVVDRGWVPPERLTVIRNALIRPPVTSREVDEARMLRQEKGTSGPPPVLLKLAMFRPEKNHQWLIETLAGLPGDWELWLLGDGETRPSCEEWVRRQGLAHKVHFLGQVDNPVPFLLACDVVVHASLRESLPNALVEAQSLGKPIVAVDVGGVRECFVEGVSGTLIRPADAEAFRAAVTGWLDSPERRENAVATAQEHFTRSFAAPGQVAAYLDLFARLTHVTPGP